MKRLDVVVGMKIGEFTVVEDLQEPVNGRHFAVVKCRCGRLYKRNVPDLIRKERKRGTVMCLSCSISEINKVCKVRHGDTVRGRKHPLYHVWAVAKERCSNPKVRDYPNYGGRGITMCEVWANNYLAFKEWAIAKGWRKGLQLDRIDNSKGYSPDNCHFVTARENSNNRRKTLYINGVPSSVYFDGCSHHPSVNYHTFYNRYWRRHWDLEKSLITPVRPQMIGG